jgi:hypothetical protein
MSSSLESKSVYIHQFGALPLEIVDLIHSFSTRESSAALRLVCVRFSQGHRWRRCRLLATASDVEASQVSRVLRSASLTRLSLANCRVLSSAKVEQILSGTHRLTRLDLCGLAVERELFWRLPSLVPYLRDLNAGLVQTTDAQPWTMGDFCHLQALTALERLDLPMWRDISFLADGFAALRSIACRSMSALDDAAETRAAQRARVRRLCAEHSHAAQARVCRRALDDDLGRRRAAAVGGVLRNADRSGVQQLSRPVAAVCARAKRERAAAAGARRV